MALKTIRVIPDANSKNVPTVNITATNPGNAQTCLQAVNVANPTIIPTVQAAASVIKGLKTIFIAGYSLATSWDPANKNANLTLSNSNLTVTAIAGASGLNVRSVASHATGKYYCEFKLTASTNVGAVAYGLAVAAYNITAVAFLGTDVGANSLGYFSNGGVNIGNVVVSTIQTWALNDVVCMAVDRTANLIWFRTNAGNWNNNAANNPATGVGGISIATLSAGAIFAALGEATLNDVATTNFGATAYAQTVPSGFGNW